jgi:hypothetical protein
LDTFTSGRAEDDYPCTDKPVFFQQTAVVMWTLVPTYPCPTLIIHPSGRLNCGVAEVWFQLVKSPMEMDGLIFLAYMASFSRGVSVQSHVRRSAAIAAPTLVQRRSADTARKTVERRIDIYTYKAVSLSGSVLRWLCRWRTMLARSLNPNFPPLGFWSKATVKLSSIAERSRGGAPATVLRFVAENSAG